MVDRVSGFSRVNNDRCSTHMTWICQLCKEKFSIPIDRTPVQFVDCSCKRCGKVYELHNYFEYLN